MAKAIFEQMFDGPDSVFGRIFGPSTEAIREANAVVRKATKRTIRFRLSKKQVQALHAGAQIEFRVGDQTFLIIGEKTQ